MERVYSVSSQNILEEWSVLCIVPRNDLTPCCHALSLIKIEHERMKYCCHIWAAAIITVYRLIPQTRRRQTFTTISLLLFHNDTSSDFHVYPDTSKNKNIKKINY